MKQIIAAQSRAETCELVTLALMQELWLKLYENLDFVHTKERTDDSAASQARLQLMMQYMHQNYQSNISLEDLSRLRDAQQKHSAESVSQIPAYNADQISHQLSFE